MGLSERGDRGLTGSNFFIHRAFTPEIVKGSPVSPLLGGQLLVLSGEVMGLCSGQSWGGLKSTDVHCPSITTTRKSLFTVSTSQLICTHTKKNTTPNMNWADMREYVMELDADACYQLYTQMYMRLLNRSRGSWYSLTQILFAVAPRTNKKADKKAKESARCALVDARSVIEAHAGGNNDAPPIALLSCMPPAQTLLHFDCNFVDARVLMCLWLYDDTACVAEAIRHGWPLSRTHPYVENTRGLRSVMENWCGGDGRNLALAQVAANCDECHDLRTVMQKVLTIAPRDAAMYCVAGEDIASQVCESIDRTEKGEAERLFAVISSSDTQSADDVAWTTFLYSLAGVCIGSMCPKVANASTAHWAAFASALAVFAFVGTNTHTPLDIGCVAGSNVMVDCRTFLDARLNSSCTQDDTQTTPTAYVQTFNISQ